MESQFPSSPVLFTFLIFVFMVFRRWRKSKNDHSALNLPPGPWKLPIIGNMHLLAGSPPHRRLRDLSTKYGPLMQLKLGELTHVVVSSTEAAREILKIHDINFAQRPRLISGRIFAYNYTDIAFSPHGDYWRQLRKVCALELLSAKRVQSFRSIREQEMSNLVTSISSKADLIYVRKFNSM